MEKMGVFLVNEFNQSLIFRMKGGYLYRSVTSVYLTIIMMPEEFLSEIAKTPGWLQ